MRGPYSRLLALLFFYFAASSNLWAETHFDIPDDVDLSRPFQLGIINGPSLFLDWQLPTLKFSSPWNDPTPLWIKQDNKNWALSPKETTETEQPIVALSTHVNLFTIPPEHWQTIPHTPRIILIFTCIALGLSTLALTKFYLNKKFIWISLIVPFLFWWACPHYRHIITWEDQQQTWVCQKQPPSHPEFFSVTLSPQQTLYFWSRPQQQGHILAKQKDSPSNSIHRQKALWFSQGQVNIFVHQTQLWQQWLIWEKNK